MEEKRIKLYLGKIRIYKKYIIQLILIYLLLQYQGGTFYYTHNEFFKPLIFGAFSIALVVNFKKIKDKNLIIFTFAICVLIFMISLINANETGINTILEIVGTIIFTYIIVMIDSENVLTVYVRLVSFLALMSLICFALIQISNNGLLSFMIHSRGEKNDLFFGGIFYTIRYVWYYDLRNCGIFTEPGLYCVALISGMFILLFMENELNLSKRQKRRTFFVLICTILSTMSAAGLMSLGTLLLLYLFSKPKSNITKNNIKKYILIMILIGTVIIIADYAVNGMNSFIYTYVLSKMSVQQLEIEGNTGNARLTTIIFCINTLIHHPLGVGMTYVTGRLPQYAVGAKYLIFIASYGIVTSIIFYFFIIKNIFGKNACGIFGAIAFIGSYIIMSSAQSMIFYPCFMLIVLIYRKRKLQNVRIKYNNPGI